MMVTSNPSLFGHNQTCNADGSPAKEQNCGTGASLCFFTHTESMMIWIFLGFWGFVLTMTLVKEMNPSRKFSYCCLALGRLLIFKQEVK